MKRTVSTLALSVGLSIAAFGADWSGKLVDATCKEQQPQEQQQAKATLCDATSATLSFAIDVAGKMYKLDATGNSKAAAALKSRADRSADPAKSLSTSFTARVTGTEKDGVIAVESIDVP